MDVCYLDSEYIPKAVVQRALAAHPFTYVTKYERDPQAAAAEAKFVYTDGRGLHTQYLYNGEMRFKMRNRLNARPVFDKASLHRILSRDAPDTICRTVVASKDFRIDAGQVWILRANFGWGGKANAVVTSQQEFDREYDRLLLDGAKRNQVRATVAASNAVIIASEYIMAPMLYRQRKFHLRVYLMLRVDADGTKKAWLLREGQIVPALDRYVAGDWANPRIHDTHMGSNPRIGKFPADLGDAALDAVLGMFKAAIPHLMPHIKRYEEIEYNYDIYGCDVMLTAAGAAKLIEINRFPGLYHFYANPTTAMFPERMLRGLFGAIMPGVFSGDWGGQELCEPLYSGQ